MLQNEEESVTGVQSRRVHVVHIVISTGLPVLCRIKQMLYQLFLILSYDSLKNQYVNQNSTLDDGSLALITDKGYDIKIYNDQEKNRQACRDDYAHSACAHGRDCTPVTDSSLRLSERSKLFFHTGIQTGDLI